MPDFINETADAATVALKAYAPLTAIVDGTQVYNSETPTAPAWPWVLVGIPTENGNFESGYDSASMSLTVHGFAKGPGKQSISAIGDAIKRALNESVLYRNGVELHFTHEQTQIIRDSAEQSAYHAICRFAVGANSEKSA